MMASEYAPSNAYDLLSEVASGKNITISHGNMQFKTRIDNRIVVPKVSLIGQYHGILSKYIVEKEYTAKDFLILSASQIVVFGFVWYSRAMVVVIVHQ